MNIRFSLLSFVLALFFISILADLSLAMSKRPGRFDKASNECIKCHKIEANKGMGPTHTPHLLGIDYRRLTETDPTLTPIKDLEPELIFVDGKVSCVTCHVEYAEETHMELFKERNRDGAAREKDPMLRVDNRGSALCLRCHRK